MLREHAITHREPLTIGQVEYLCQKSNRLGELGKHLSRVYQEEDDEGKHIYFEVVKITYGQAGTD